MRRLRVSGPIATSPMRWSRPAFRSSATAILAEWTRKIFGAIGARSGWYPPLRRRLARYGVARCGQVRWFWESGLKPWDVAAGILLVREAGGFVTDYRGGSQPIERQQVIAGNDALHSRLHKLLVGALR
jgi:myo-inositol-1(or 4)-monophosphatase